MSITQTWRLPDLSTITAPYTPNTYENRNYNRAFCCPTCGEVWARQTISIANHWDFYSKPWPRCPGGVIIMRSGSIWQSWEKHYLSQLPKEVLIYELLNNERLRKEHEK